MIGMNVNFLKEISDLLENARKQAKTAVNISMVYTYFEIGRRIYEEEQAGEDRAAYGKQLIERPKPPAMLGRIE